MILTTHALTGAAIGKLIPNPWIVIPLSLAAHFAMDSLRHGEYVESLDSKVTIRNTAWKVILDGAFGFSVILWAIGWNHLDLVTARNMLLGALFSALPDFITFLFWKFKFRFLENYYQFHSVWLHSAPPLSPGRRWTLRNAANDILISTIAIILLFIKF